jgi:hypothetical protein
MPSSRRLFPENDTAGSYQQCFHVKRVRKTTHAVAFEPQDRVMGVDAVHGITI